MYLAVTLPLSCLYDLDQPRGSLALLCKPFLSVEELFGLFKKTLLVDKLWWFRRLSNYPSIHHLAIHQFSMATSSLLISWSLSHSALGWGRASHGQVTINYIEYKLNHWLVLVEESCIPTHYDVHVTRCEVALKLHLPWLFEKKFLMALIEKLSVTRGEHSNCVFATFNNIHWRDIAATSSMSSWQGDGPWNKNPKEQHITHSPSALLNAVKCC